MNANYIDTLNVSCVGNYSCWNGRFFVNHAKTVSIYGERVDALLEADIYATNLTNKFKLDCLDYGCQGTEIYAPSDPNKTELSCFGHGCYDINLFLEGYYDGFAKVLVEWMWTIMLWINVYQIGGYHARSFNDGRDEMGI